MISKIGNKLYTGLFIFMAIALQIQISFFATEDYKGLRLNLADIMLPFIGLIILFTLCQKTTAWPQFHIKHTYYWLAGLGLILIAALGHGYLLYDQWSYWGLTNKIIGWFVLSAYFLLGGWLASNAKENVVRIFLKSIIAFFLLVFTVQALDLTAYYLTISPKPLLIEFPLAGLMANKNAFAFLFLSLLGTITIFNHQYLSLKLIYFFWFIAPFALAYTGSRSAAITLLLLIPILFVCTRETANWKKMFLFLLIGIIAVFSLYKTAPKKFHVFHPKRIEVTAYIKNIVADTMKGEKITKIEQKTIYAGDSIRLKIIDAALNTIKEHPFLGGGLGSAFIKQEEQWGKFINIIDCTPLWLWAETGLIGLAAFLIFYFLILRRLWQNVWNEDNDDIAKKLSLSVFMMLIIFGVMCLFHEILYTRFLWFFMGLALAIPLKRDASNPA